MNGEAGSGDPAESQPDVLQAVWPDDQIRALFADLDAGADVEHVQVRRQGPGGIEDRKTTLSEAEATFAAGQAKAIQIKYRFGGQSWCDTLMPQADGVRIVRHRPG